MMTNYATVTCILKLSSVSTLQFYYFNTRWRYYISLILNFFLPVVALSGKLVGARVPTSSGSLQRSRSDIDVNAAATAKSRLTTVPASSPFSSAAALPPGSYASLGNPSVTIHYSELAFHIITRIDLAG